MISSREQKQTKDPGLLRVVIARARFRTGDHRAIDPKVRASGRTADPRVTGPRVRASGRTAGPRVTGPRVRASGRTAGPRVTGPRVKASGRTADPRVTGPKARASGRTAGPRVTGPKARAVSVKAGRTSVEMDTVPRVGVDQEVRGLRGTARDKGVLPAAVGKRLLRFPLSSSLSAGKSGRNPRLLSTSDLTGKKSGKNRLSWKRPRAKDPKKAALENRHREEPLKPRPRNKNLLLSGKRLLLRN